MDQPCDWPVSYAGCNDTEQLEGMEPADRDFMERAAINYLWNWTGRIFGICPEVVRPCRRACTSSTYWSGVQSPAGLYREASWADLTCGGCLTRCTCGDTAASVRLRGPIQSIDHVSVDGEILDPTSYRVDNRRILVRTDGQRWPMCQNLDVDPTEQGTWEVGYQRGLPVPEGGQIAAGVLANELALALCKSSKCRLPQRVQTITREGVTVAMLDGMEGLAEGKTGIWVIDSWTTSIMHPPRAGRVYSPDLPNPRTRRRSWQI